MSGDKDLSPLFSNNDDDTVTAELFKDKVRALLERFDVDKDDHLKFPELAALQRATAETVLTEEMYVMACRALDCHPSTGISLGALKLTYAAPGSDLDADYDKVFSLDQKQPPTFATPDNAKTTDTVYEIGADGAIDISPPS